MIKKFEVNREEFFNHFKCLKIKMLYNGYVVKDVDWIPQQKKQGRYYLVARIDTKYKVLAKLLDTYIKIKYKITIEKLVGLFWVTLWTLGLIKDKIEGESCKISQISIFHGNSGRKDPRWKRRKQQSAILDLWEAWND